MTDTPEAPIVDGANASAIAPVSNEQQLQDHFEEGLSNLGESNALHDRIADLEEGNSAYAAQIAQLTVDNAALTKRAEDAEAALSAKPKVATAKPAEPKARKFKAIGGDDRLSVEDLQARIAGGDDVEIAFLDARGNEIAGSKPIDIKGDVWKATAGGLLLAEPVKVNGPSDGSYQIHGYALLVDGKPVAIQTRFDPLAVAPGSRNSIENDIVF